MSDVMKQTQQLLKLVNDLQQFHPTQQAYLGAKVALELAQSGPTISAKEYMEARQAYQKALKDLLEWGEEVTLADPRFPEEQKASIRTMFAKARAGQLTHQPLQKLVDLIMARPK